MKKLPSLIILVLLILAAGIYAYLNFRTFSKFHTGLLKCATPDGIIYELGENQDQCRLGLLDNNNDFYYLTVSREQQNRINLQDYIIFQNTIAVKGETYREPDLPHPGIDVTEVLQEPPAPPSPELIPTT